MSAGRARARTGLPVLLLLLLFSLTTLRGADGGRLDAAQSRSQSLSLLQAQATALAGRASQRLSLGAGAEVQNTFVPTFDWSWHAIQDSMGPIPTQREGHSAVEVEDMLIVFGGCFLDKHCFNDVYAYLTSRKLWVLVTTVGPAPAEREGHTATMVGDLMYVYGGSSDVGYLDDVHVLKTSLAARGGNELVMAWGRPVITAPGSQVPEGREGHSGTLIGSRIFYFGGYTPAGFTNELLILDTVTHAWERPFVSTTKPAAREGHSASYYDGRIFVWGGFTDGGSLQDLWTLDTASLAWEAVVPTGLAPAARDSHAALMRGNELLILAGCNFGRRRCFCDLHVLNVDDMSWRLEPIGSLGEPLSPRESLTATMVQGSIYVFGGCYLAQRCFSDLYMLAPAQGALRCGGDSANGTCSGHGECRAYLTPRVDHDAAALLQLSSHAATPGIADANSTGAGHANTTAAANATNATTPSNNTTVNTNATADSKRDAGSVVDESKFAVSYRCMCYESWQGSFCEIPNQCPGDCSGHGSCMAGGVCACSKGYRGANCSLLNPLVHGCPNLCSGHGRCQFVGQAKPPAQSKEASTNSSELPATGAAAATAPEARFRQQPTAESRSHRAQLSPQQSLVLTESNPEYSSLLQVEDSPGDRELKSECICVDGWTAFDCSVEVALRERAKLEIPPPLQEISGNVAASPSAAQKMDIPVVDSKAKVQKEKETPNQKAKPKQASDTAPATSSTSGSADAAAADDSCKQDAECAHLKNPLLAKSVPACCDGTCTLKQKSWKGKWVCPADCVGRIFGKKGTCAECSSSLDCTGKRVGCCNKKCAKKQKRGIFGIYSCPKDHSFRSAASTVGTVAATPESTEPASCAGDLEHCSGHGICYENRCYCNPPYAGTRCATALSTTTVKDSRLAARFFASTNQLHWIAAAALFGIAGGVMFPASKLYRRWRHRTHSRKLGRGSRRLPCLC